MDDLKDVPKPPLPLPEPDKPAAPRQEHTPPAPDAPEDLAEVAEIEPRDEPAEEIEQLPRERPPAGRQAVREHGGRRGERDRRERRDQGHQGSHRPHPFLTDRRRGHSNQAKDAKREILVNCSPEETRVAVLENNQLIELLIERSESEKIVGNIYKGKIENVLPGISSAFVNIGLEKNAYLYVSDVIPTAGHSPSAQIEK